MSSRAKPVGSLVDLQAAAALVLWVSGKFDTADIAKVLGTTEGAVYRMLYMARDGARIDRRRA
jgi:hypothetical protein